MNRSIADAQQACTHERCFFSSLPLLARENLSIRKLVVESLKETAKTYMSIILFLSWYVFDRTRFENRCTLIYARAGKAEVWEKEKMRERENYRLPNGKTIYVGGRYKRLNNTCACRPGALIRHVVGLIDYCGRRRRTREREREEVKRRRTTVDVNWCANVCSQLRSNFDRMQTRRYSALWFLSSSTYYRFLVSLLSLSFSLALVFSSFTSV